MGKREFILRTACLFIAGVGIYCYYLYMQMAVQEVINKIILETGGFF